MISDLDIDVVQNCKASLLQSKLSEVAREEADVIAKSVLDYYISVQHRKAKRNEYPPVVVACAQDEKKWYTETTHHDIPRQCINNRLLKRLENRLSGQYGKESQYVKKNLIGHCAEPQAANELLRNENVKDLDYIYFGKAYRPRTGVVIPPCENCRIVFDKGVVIQ